ncbi:tyrosine-type recombinase/integrase [Bradyrhizobium sp.]|uniref:tyrosine-type recombinase/integrase n=1 Tax=Bradyrhizobium sp. TaxID=376 RepID=UPI003BB09235
MPGTVNAALVSYYQSSAFTKGLGESTQQNRRAILERFREEHGDKRVAYMHTVALQKIIDKKTPAAARNFKKAMRGFIKHCISLRLIKVDPLAGIELVKMKTKGHHPWESNECAQYEEHYPFGTRARLAYELLLQASQSRCDVVRMGRQHIRQGMMSMRRQKTDVPFNVTVMPRLQEAIDAMPVCDHLTFLVTAQGKPFTAAGFGNWFRDMCRAAKLPERCTSHGLRKAAATYLAEQGATDHQLMAWFGWSSISQAQVYTKAANGKRMGRSAGKLISGTGIGSPIDPVSQNEVQAIENTGAGK